MYGGIQLIIRLGVTVFLVSFPYKLIASQSSVKLSVYKRLILADV